HQTKKLVISSTENH
ncbi:hypothetical protein D047_1126B, partial [Vibrio parahaemolyticus VPTS-2010_2]